jgi:hypothetical protein
MYSVEWHNKLHTGKVWKDAAQHYIAYYPNASLEELWKSALRPHIKVSRCSVRDMNGTPHKYKFGYKFSVLMLYRQFSENLPDNRHVLLNFPIIHLIRQWQKCERILGAAGDLPTHLLTYLPACLQPNYLPTDLSTNQSNDRSTNQLQSL